MSKVYIGIREVDCGRDDVVSIVRLALDVDKSFEDTEGGNSDMPSVSISPEKNLKLDITYHQYNYNQAFFIKKK